MLDDMNTIKSLLKFWLPLAAAITLLCGVIYGVAQQAYRTGADDPQIQMAEDAARSLAAGEAVEDVLPSQPVDIAESLAPYLIIFDSNSQAVASNAVLHGKTPTVPQGVLEAARLNGQNKVTWQPEPGVRSATVVTPVDGGQKGYVLAGRSLREVEKRESSLTFQVGVGWAATLLATLVLALLANWLVKDP
jgi:hypothetical protein